MVARIDFVRADANHHSGARRLRVACHTVRHVVHNLIGVWRIVEMDIWDVEAIELLGPALVHIEPDGHGRFGFIAVEGQLDWKSDDRPSTDRIAFTWEGDDEGSPVSGRGWATVSDNDHLVGHLYFHLGDDSSFRAVRQPHRSRLR